MATSSTLHDVIWARLQTAVDIDVYDAEMPATPRTDSDGVVSAYAVLYTSPGNLMASALDGGQRCLLGSRAGHVCGWRPQPRAGLCGRGPCGSPGRVTVDGVSRVIRAREENPGPLRTDPNVWPPRHYAPLEFDLFAP
jgi:hypothetical protein